MIVAIALACLTVRVGSATTISPSTESASGVPLRSVMEPRVAGRVTVTTPSARALAT
jgi:hypothetical protein